MNTKIMGGILLVVGTTIGAGMLALPVATANLGFFGSVALLIFCWAIMTACAFLFLEANLWLPANTNFISMTGATLGKSGQAIAWIAYLVLLYSIISAYMAGGGDLFHYLLSTAGIHISLTAASLLFMLVLGAVVYLGIKAVDYVNRGLMFGKMGAYVLLVLLILPFISPIHLADGEFKHIISPSSVSITVVSFTCLMIVPSLRTYFGDDVKSLRKVIFIGTLIPLFCYIAWDMVIMGVIPLNGQPGLVQILHAPNSNSMLVATLTSLLDRQTITALAKFFTSVCMATSFLSVSLCLSDFLSDGLKIAKKGTGNLIIFGATFLPPSLVVLFYPDAFLRGLNYAGLSCFILMVLFPPLMVWRGRYSQALKSAKFSVPGGKSLLVLLLVFATILLGFGVRAQFG